jgi:hypothetical protein
MYSSTLVHSIDGAQDVSKNEQKAVGIMDELIIMTIIKPSKELLDKLASHPFDTAALETLDCPLTTVH